MIRQADRFSMHIARGGKGVNNRLREKTVCATLLHCYIATLLYCQCVLHVIEWHWSNALEWLEIAPVSTMLRRNHRNCEISKTAADIDLTQKHKQSPAAPILTYIDLY